MSVETLSRESAPTAEHSGEYELSPALMSLMGEAALREDVDRGMAEIDAYLAADQLDLDALFDQAEAINMLVDEHDGDLQAAKQAYDQAVARVDSAENLALWDEALEMNAAFDAAQAAIEEKKEVDKAEDNAGDIDAEPKEAKASTEATDDTSDTATLQEVAAEALDDAGVKVPEGATVYRSDSNGGITVVSPDGNAMHVIAAGAEGTTVTSYTVGENGTLKVKGADGTTEFKLVDFSTARQHAGAVQVPGALTQGTHSYAVPKAA